MRRPLIRWTPASHPGPRWREPDGRSETPQEPSRGTIAARCDQQRLSGSEEGERGVVGLDSEQQTISAVAESQENILPEGNIEPSGRGGERLRPSENAQENESDAAAFLT